MLEAIAGAVPQKVMTQQIVLESKVTLTIGWNAFTLEESGGLAVTNYLVMSDEADFVMGNTVENGQLTQYSKTITQPGNEGKIYRFRVAAQNVLGIGPYSDEIQLMATDAPLVPVLLDKFSSRTLTSIDLEFQAPADDGGSPITGYQLFRDQGITGSPFL